MLFFFSVSFSIAMPHRFGVHLMLISLFGIYHSLTAIRAKHNAMAAFSKVFNTFLTDSLFGSNSYCAPKAFLISYLGILFKQKLQLCFVLFSSSPFFNFFILYFGFVLWTWDNNTNIHTSAHTKWTYLCSAHCFDVIPSTGCILFNIISLCDFSIFLYTFIGCSVFHSSLLFYRSICFDFSTWASFHIFPLFLQKRRLDCVTQCQIFDFGFLVAFIFYSVDFCINSCLAGFMIDTRSRILMSSKILSI